MCEFSVKLTTSALCIIIAASALVATALIVHPWAH
jgi:hypothetical protein